MFKLLTEEHSMIRDTVGKLFADLGAADTQKRQLERCRIDSTVVGGALTELGLLGASADASMATAQVQAIAAVEAGAAALPFPVSEALAAQAAILRGGGPLGPQAVRTLAIGATAIDRLPVFDHGRLGGTARLVAFATMEGPAVLEAKHAGEVTLVQTDLAGASVRLLPRSSVEPDYPVHDVIFDGHSAALVPNGVLAKGGGVDFLRNRITLLAAAEIAGACRRMVAMTREYLLVRSQFGQVLGANQALKHRLAENHVRVEAMTAAIDYAAAASDAAADDAEASICAAKGFATLAGKRVADSALQLHGAIGYTMEYPLQLLMRRVHRLGASYGSARGERLFKLFEQTL